MAIFSLIHSLNTTFGTSVFEPVAETLAKIRFPYAHKQFVVGNKISETAQTEIQHILNELTIGNEPNKHEEIDRIRKTCNKGNVNRLKTVKVDLFVKDDKHLFDIKTAKPNISNFKDFKRTLLEWIAIYLYTDPNANVHSYIAIPYNPY